MRAWKYISAIFAIGCFATGGTAQVSLDFEGAGGLDGWVATGVGGVTPDYSLSTEYAHSGTQSLYVGADTYLDFDLGSQQYGTLTLWVYDQGSTFGVSGQNGPKWGMASDPAYLWDYQDPVTLEHNFERSFIGAGMIYRDWLTGSSNYGWSCGWGQADSNDWFTAYHMPTRATNQWAQWDISIIQDTTFGDKVVVTRIGERTTRQNVAVNAFSLEGAQGARSIYVYGGWSDIPLFGSDVTGIWIDDAVWTPAGPPDPRLDPFTKVGAHIEVRTDQAASGDSSLHLGTNEFAYLRFTDTPVFGTLELKVYDRGASDRFQNSAYGPRWGVMNNDIANPVIPSTGDPEDSMIGNVIAWRDFFDGNGGYGYTNGDPGRDGATFPSAYGFYEFGGPRRVSVQPTRLDDNDPVNDPDNHLGTPVDGEGAWSTWRYEVHAGGLYTITLNPGQPDEQVVVVPMDDPATPDVDEGMSISSTLYNSLTSANGFNELVLYGGQIDNEGIWFDDIVFTPDPGQGVEGFTMDFEGNTCRDVNAVVGDFNCDNQVNLTDLVTLGENYNQPGDYTMGDTNADGQINLTDLVTLGENYNTSVPTPEPASLGLLLAGSLLVIRRR